MRQILKVIATLFIIATPSFAVDKTVNLYPTLAGASIDRASDWIPIWDTSANAMKKVSTDSLFTGYVIGTNIEAWDADLDYLASFTPSANVKSILNAADYAAIKTLLGLTIGTNVQAYDADLTTYAGITPSANVQTLLGTASYAAFRSALGVAIGTNVEAWDAQLDDVAGLTPTDNAVVIGNGVNFVVESGATLKTSLGLTIGTDVQAYDADLAYLAGFTPTANVKSILNAADYAAIKTLLSLTIGTDVQAYDADLTTYAGITPSSNVQTLLGSADYAAFRTSLGLGTGDGPTFSGATLGSGAFSHSGSEVISPTALSGTAIDMTVAESTKTASAAHTFTFTGSHTAGRRFSLTLIGDTVDRTITIPSSISVDRQGATITTFLLPASPYIARLTWVDDGSNYYLYGDPGTSSGLLNVATGKTATISNTITITGTDSTTMTLPSTSQTLAGLTAVQTLSGKTIAMPVSPASDDTLEGTTITGLNNSGGITQWDAVYLNASGAWVRADADGSGTYPARGLATATATTGNATDVVTRGIVRNDAWNWTIGGNVYLSKTGTADNTLTQTAPSTTGDKLQVIGYAVSADAIFLTVAPDYGVIQ